MPAEWEPHRATWIAWPHHAPDWPGRFGPIPWCFGEIVRALTRGETVSILVDDSGAELRARRMLGRLAVDLDRVEFHRIVTDRSWIRDTGPIFVRRPERRVAATLWRFNGWAKYANHRRDAKVNAAIAQAAGTSAIPIEVEGRRVVLEGGAIDVDGEGTLLATEECLLSDVQARNPGLGRAALESALGAALGIRQVVWLGRGIAGDDTHGHIDDVCRFVAPGVVVLCAETDPHDANYQLLAENRERLEARATPPAASSTSSRSRCRLRSSSTACGCQPVTPTSTSPTDGSWSRCSTTRATAPLSASSPISSPIAR